MFGAENVIVRPFDRHHLQGGDARTDLYALAGVDVADLLRDEPDLNASASVEEVQ